MEKIKEETIIKWKKSGLLEGLDAPIPENQALLFAPNPIQMITPEPLQSLLLDDDLLLAIIGGDGERVTVRKGRRDIKLGELHFIGSRDKTLHYIVGVTEVRYLRVVDIDDDVIKAEVFSNWNDFYEDMKKYYPDIDLTDEVTVVYFEIADVKTQ